MRAYLSILVLLTIAVDFLLLTASNRIFGYRSRIGRLTVAAVMGGIYAGICMTQDFYIMNHVLVRIIVLWTVSLIAYGVSFSAIKRGALYIALSTALGEVSLWMERNNILPLVIFMIGLTFLSIITNKDSGHSRFVEVQIYHHGKVYPLIALYDTGNMLKDPISGSPVLVAGADLAHQLLGLTAAQLSSPVDSMLHMAGRGLRLIPYRSVGQPSGMLLALRVDSIQINGVNSGNIVAFAPQILGSQSSYQALAGGNIG